MTKPTPTQQSATWPAHTDAGGQSHDLSHLNDYQTNFTTKNGTSFRVRVQFGHHCFTRSTLPTDTPDMIYQASPFGDSRTFDPVRYALSLQLPAYIAQFMTGQCYNTGNGKFFVIELVGAQGQEYEIYFRAYRSQNSKGLVLDIRSAFVRDLSHGGSRTHQGKIHFGAILSHAQKGTQPKTAHPPKKI